MNILYIEDNLNDAHLVQRYVETTPHQLLLVSTLQDAWMALNDNSFELIMVDILLANDRSGYDFAYQMREQHYTQPLIAVTALNTPQDIAATRRAGFDGILEKPFQITELAKVIQRYET